VTLEIQIIPTSFLKKTKMTDTLTVVEREENKGKKKREGVGTKLWIYRLQVLRVEGRVGNPYRQGSFSFSILPMRCLTL
jgi:hypothetical protein